MAEKIKDNAELLEIFRDHFEQIGLKAETPAADATKAEPATEAPAQPEIKPVSSPLAYSQEKVLEAAFSALTGGVATNNKGKGEKQSKDQPRNETMPLPVVPYTVISSPVGAFVGSISSTTLVNSANPAIMPGLNSRLLSSTPLSLITSNGKLHLAGLAPPASSPIDFRSESIGGSVYTRAAQLVETLANASKRSASLIKRLADAQSATFGNGEIGQGATAASGNTGKAVSTLGDVARTSIKTVGYADPKATKTSGSIRVTSNFAINPSLNIASSAIPEKEVGLPAEKTVRQWSPATQEAMASLTKQAQRALTPEDFLAALRQGFQAVSQQIAAVDNHVTAVDAHVTTVEERLNQVEAIAKRAEQEAGAAKADATTAKEQATKAEKAAITNITLAQKALNHMGDKNCAITTDHQAIREKLMREIEAMGGTLTEQKYYDLRYRIVAEYNATHEDKIDHTFFAQISIEEAEELLDRGISFKIIEKLSNGNRHVVLPLGHGKDEKGVYIVAVNGNVEGSDEERKIYLKDLDFTGNGIRIIIEEKNSQEIAEEQRLSRDELDNTDRLEGNSGVNAGQGGNGAGAAGAAGKGTPAGNGAGAGSGKGTAGKGKGFGKGPVIVDMSSMNGAGEEFGANYSGISSLVDANIATGLAPPAGLSATSSPVSSIKNILSNISKANLTAGIFVFVYVVSPAQSFAATLVNNTLSVVKGDTWGHIVLKYFMKAGEKLWGENGRAIEAWRQVNGADQPYNAMGYIQAGQEIDVSKILDVVEQDTDTVLNVPSLPAEDLKQKGAEIVEQAVATPDLFIDHPWAVLVIAVVAAVIISFIAIKLYRNYKAHKAAKLAEEEAARQAAEEKARLEEAMKNVKATSDFYFDNEGNIVEGGLYKPAEKEEKARGKSIRAKKRAAREEEARRTALVVLGQPSTEIVSDVTDDSHAVDSIDTQRDTGIAETNEEKTGEEDIAEPEDAELAVFEQAVRENPNDIAVHADLGLAYFQRNRFDDARTELIEALQIINALREIMQPIAMKAFILFNLGLVEWNLNDHDAALSYLRESKRINPASLEKLPPEILAEINAGIVTASPVENKQAPVRPVKQDAAIPGANIPVEKTITLSSSAVNQLAVVNFARELGVSRDYVITHQSSSGCQPQTGVGTSIFSLAPPLELARTSVRSTLKSGTKMEEGENGKSNDEIPGRNERVGDRIPDERTNGAPPKGDPAGLGRQGDLGTEASPIRLSGERFVKPAGIHTELYSGRAPPYAALIAKLLDSAVVVRLLTVLSRTSKTNNPIKLNQPIALSVAGEPLANVVKGGAGALLQGLTPLVAVLTTKSEGGVLCAETMLTSGSPTSSLTKVMAPSLPQLALTATGRPQTSWLTALSSSKPETFGLNLTRLPLISSGNASGLNKTASLLTGQESSPLKDEELSRPTSSPALSTLKRIFTISALTSLITLIYNSSVYAYEIVDDTYLRFGIWAVDHSNCLWNVAIDLLHKAGVNHPTAKQILAKISEIVGLNPDKIKNPDIVQPYPGQEYLVKEVATKEVTKAVTEFPAHPSKDSLLINTPTTPDSLNTTPALPNFPAQPDKTSLFDAPNVPATPKEQAGPFDWIYNNPKTAILITVAVIAAVILGYFVIKYFKNRKDKPAAPEKTDEAAKPVETTDTKDASEPANEEILQREQAERELLDSTPPDSETIEKDRPATPAPAKEDVEPAPAVEPATPETEPATAADKTETTAPAIEDTIILEEDTTNVTAERGAKEEEVKDFQSVNEASDFLNQNRIYRRDKGTIEEHYRSIKAAEDFIKRNLGPGDIVVIGGEKAYKIVHVFPNQDGTISGFEISRPDGQDDPNGDNRFIRFNDLYLGADAIDGATQARVTITVDIIKAEEKAQEPVEKEVKAPAGKITARIATLVKGFIARFSKGAQKAAEELRTDAAGRSEPVKVGMPVWWYIRRSGDIEEITVTNIYAIDNPNFKTPCFECAPPYNIMPFSEVYFHKEDALKARAEAKEEVETPDAPAAKPAKAPKISLFSKIFNRNSSKQAKAKILVQLKVLKKRIAGLEDTFILNEEYNPEAFNSDIDSAIEDFEGLKEEIQAANLGDNKEINALVEAIDEKLGELQGEGEFEEGLDEEDFDEEELSSSPISSAIRKFIITAITPLLLACAAGQQMRTVDTRVVPEEQ
ncbi:MAG: tetratricopeptide repeat protein, partial [Bacteroidales bacterium]